MKKVPAVIKSPDSLYLSRIKEYRWHRNCIGEAVLRAALRAHASLEAVDMVNDILDRKMNLTGVRVDHKAFTSKVEVILQIEVGSILANHSTLSKTAIGRITERMISQILPTRDNISPVGHRSQPDRLRVEDLERVIAREARRTAQEKK